tara:strand:+ start:3682 stop:3879 length:198 start_codon:yes stop_codon:yes gene_type:complete
MKVKMFGGTDVNEMEKEINEWFEKNNTIIVQERKQNTMSGSRTIGGGHKYTFLHYIVISIFYENK